MRDYARQQASILLRRLAFQLNRAAECAGTGAAADLYVALRRFGRCLSVFRQFFPAGGRGKVRSQLRELRLAVRAELDWQVAIEVLGEAGMPASSGIVARISTERRRAASELSLAIRRLKRRSFSRKWRSRLEI